MERHTLRVKPGEEEQRLDRFVSDRLELSRARVQKLLAQGRVTLDGRKARKSQVVSPGSIVEVEVPKAEAVDTVAEDLPLRSYTRTRTF